jgi:hypothetical protein
MKKRYVNAALGLLLFPVIVSAQDSASEAEMFPAPELAVQAPAAPGPAGEKKTLGFSGEVLSVAEDIVYSSASGSRFSSYIVGNLMLDARLKNGVKAFANMETGYYPKTRETTSVLREAFLDFNINRGVYFRTGKQVLQWGRCYLWNPTDLINVEKKPFVRKIGYREGAYGLKMHIPFGSDYNIYGFLDTGGAQEDRDLGGALKFEFLTGKTEMAFSGWARRGRRVVFGYDLSSRLGDIDIAGEASVARRDNTRFIRDDGGALEIYRKNESWAPKAAVNFSRGFRLGNFNDRLTVASEFFYNQTGYSGNIFRDRAAYSFSVPLASQGPGGTVAYQNSGTKKEFLLGHGLYEVNYLSRYYGALFTGVSRFIITDLTLNLNYVRNLNDDSGVLSTGVTYKNMNDFSAGCMVNAYLGPADREYTFSGAKFSVQLTAGVSF